MRRISVALIALAAACSMAPTRIIAQLQAIDVPDNAPGSVSWQQWPKNPAPCSDNWVETATEDFGGSAKYEALYYLSICAHSSVGNIQAFTYALSRSGSTKEGALRSLAGFAAQIQRDPQGLAACLRAKKIDPVDKTGSWRDLTDLIVEVARHSPGDGSACF